MREAVCQDADTAGPMPSGGDGSLASMTLVWFIIWLIANNVGGNEALTLDPVNGWVGTLILAVALDLGGNHARGGAGARTA